MLCGKDGYSDWDRYVLQECLRYVDMHSIHYYSMGDTHGKNISSVYAAERAISICSSLIDVARCEFDLSCFPEMHLVSTRAKSKTRPKICFDEWNVWDPIRAPGQKGAEERYTLSDALAVAIWLNVFVRNAHEVGMANIAQSVNVISPLMTTPTGLWKQTTYWPLKLFATYMQGKSVPLQVRSPRYDGETFPEWVRSTVAVPFIDASAALSDDGYINLAVVNSDEENSHEVRLHGFSECAGTQADVYTVGGAAFSAADTNSEDNNTISIRESKWDVRPGGYTFEKLSFTLLRWRIKT